MIYHPYSQWSIKWNPGRTYREYYEFKSVWINWQLTVQIGIYPCNSKPNEMLSNLKTEFVAIVPKSFIAVQTLSKIA